MTKRIEKIERRGFVLLTMALAAVALFGALGLAVDVGRLFIAKNETQSFCDAGALMAALKLDGTTKGIADAHLAVSKSGNAWNLDTTALVNSQFTVDFATSASGPWSANPSPASGYTFARVQATVPAQLFFIPVFASQFTQNVAAMAIAQQQSQTSLNVGLIPYTVVSTNPNKDQNFGLAVGNQYDLQWPQYSLGGGCDPVNDPAGCFGAPPCSGEPLASETALLQQWTADAKNYNGFWGGSGASLVAAETIDKQQLLTATVGQPITLTSGNKSSEGAILDTLVNEDLDTKNNTVSVYLNNPQHNGRRLVAVPVVDPTNYGANVPYVGGPTAVLGFAEFLLLSNGSPSNFYKSNGGNQPYCAVFVGPYLQGSTGPGAIPGGGAYKVYLVQ